MTDVRLMFLDENGQQIAVLSCLPGVPSAGDSVRFFCSDRGVAVEGRVHFVDWADEDGEVTVTVHTQRK